jgi:DNA-binding CsgD family transcriptional regulator
MLDLAHFLHFISFTLGVVAMLVVYNNRKAVRSQYLWPYIIVLLCINLVSAAHSYESFIKIKASLGNSGIDLFLNLGIMAVLLSVVRITLAYHFLMFCWRLTASAWQARYRSFFVVLVWALPGAQALAVIFPNHLAIVWLPASMIFCHLLVFMALLAGAAKVLVFARRVEQTHAARWLRVFFWFWMIFNLCIFANRFAGYAYLVSLDTQLLNFGIITLLMNTLHIFFASRFFRQYRSLDAERSQSFEPLISQYGVSPREQDIVRLICEGQTNKEIARVLFITPNTVRDHTSNIYRKTGVKNRTQLARLFS